jgi:hypothetical protein
MNISAEEKQCRGGERQAFRDLVADFQASETAVLEAAEKNTAEAIRLKLPAVMGYAIAAGTMSGKLTLEIMFDFTPRQKAVEVRAVVEPPAIVSIKRTELDY